MQRNVVVSCCNVGKVFYETYKAKGQGWFGRKRRTIKALDNITFDIYEHEVFGLLGPNGSGKSTLIRLLSTLLLPDSGEVKIFGLDVHKDLAKIRPLINRVSVDAAFFKKLSTIENLRYAARIYGMQPKSAVEHAVHILERLGISRHKLSTPLENFSRGMQQKVAIARALMTAPQLMLFDEPTTGLDPKSKQDVQSYIHEAQAQSPVTILLTTHDMEEAEALCDRIAIIAGGRILALDTAEGLKAKANVNTLEEAFVALSGESWEEAEERERT